MRGVQAIDANPELSRVCLDVSLMRLRRRPRVNARVGLSHLILPSPSMLGFQTNDLQLVKPTFAGRRQTLLALAGGAA